MRRGTGYLQVLGDGGYERDTFTCSHCQTVIVVRPDKGCSSMRLNRCGQCFGTICNGCVAELQRGKCAPWEKRMEAIERRGEFLKATGVQ